jgi:hypothetical protein
MNAKFEILPAIQEAANGARQRLKPYDYRLGELDNDGKKVAKIYAKAPGYVIYRTDNAIRIDMDDDHPKLGDYETNHYKIGVQLARMYSLLPENLSSTESINRLVGRALTLNVAGNCDDAKDVLRHAESRLVKLKTIQGRLQYTASAFCLSIVIFGISLLKCLEDSQIFVQVMVCGALGGMLSIVIGYRSLSIDVDADLTTNCLIGVSRIIIAVIASLFIYFSIKSNIIFSFVNEQSDHYGVFMFAMVAGFVEMLVPNIMNNLAKDAKVSSEGSAEKIMEPHSKSRTEAKS